MQPSHQTIINNVLGHLGMAKTEPPMLGTVFSKSKCVVMTQQLDTRPGFVEFTQNVYLVAVIILGSTLRGPHFTFQTFPTKLCNFRVLVGC